MHTYEFVCVSVQSNATSTFLLSRGNAVGPPDSIGRRHALGMHSGSPVASVPHTNTHTHQSMYAGTQTVSAATLRVIKKLN